MLESEKSNVLSRLIATREDVDYKETIAAYRNLSAAEIGIAFFHINKGGVTGGLRLVAWHHDNVMEVRFRGFSPSAGNIFCENKDLFYPIEGEAEDRHISWFRKCIGGFPTLKKKEQQFLLNCIDSIASYVMYPLQLMNQDLGTIYLCSTRPGNWASLHMSPLLSLYNDLNKSFFLNERFGRCLMEICQKIENIGFPSQAELRAVLTESYSDVMTDVRVVDVISDIDKLMVELHRYASVLKCTQKKIHFIPWLKAFVNRKIAYCTEVKVNISVNKKLPLDCAIMANFEQLETLFENLFFNSIQVGYKRETKDSDNNVPIEIHLNKKKEFLSVTLIVIRSPDQADNGRWFIQSKRIMQIMGGNIRCRKNPFQVYIAFPLCEG